MKPSLPRLTIVLLGAVLLAACAGRPARTGPAASGQPRATPENRPPADTRPPASGDESRADQTTAPAGATAQDDMLPDGTGVSACDDYLASYVACHRAAAIYRPDEIQGRYEAMRTSLLRDSKDPDIRPNLAARCNSLASQLRQALHGKSCQATPATAGSQAGD